MTKHETKIVAITDHERATKHSWMLTRIDGSNHPASSKGYKDGQIFYSLMENGAEVSGHDLYRLKNEAGMTPDEFETLWQTEFEEFEDGETIEVS